MKSKISATLLIVTTALAACGSKTALVWENYTFPAVGKLETRSVGESLIEQGAGQLEPVFEVAQDTLVGNKKIPKGRYDFESENRKGIWFEKDDLKFYINKADRTICIDGKDCTKIEYNLNKKLRTVSKDAFQQTLLYNGKIGNRITLGYREFSSGTARAAFSNTVDYDLSESTTVGYKGARLEVVKATNTEITYRVLSDFTR